MRMRFLLLFNLVLMLQSQAGPAARGVSSPDCPLHLLVSDDPIAEANWAARDRRKALIAESDRILLKPDGGKNPRDKKTLNENLSEILALTREFNLPPVKERPKWYVDWSAQRTLEEAQRQLLEIEPELAKYNKEREELSSSFDQAKLKLKTKTNQLRGLKIQERGLSNEEINSNPVVVELARKLETLRKARSQVNGQVLALSGKKRELERYIAQAGSVIDGPDVSASGKAPHTPAIEPEYESFDKLRERTETEAQNVREAIRGIQERKRNEARPSDKELLKALKAELKELEVTLEALDIQESVYGGQ